MENPLALMLIFVLFDISIFIIFILGGLYPKILASGTDWNTLLSNAVYKVSSAGQDANSPSDIHSWGTLVVYESGSNCVVQEYYPNNNNSEPVYRTLFDFNWTSWKTISTNLPSFYKDYADLSSLASALGVAPNRIENVDIDNLMTTAVYWFDGDNVRTAIHYPFDWGLLNVYAVYSNSWAVYQIADDMRGNRKSRNYNMEKVGWTEWINL